MRALAWLVPIVLLGGCAQDGSGAGPAAGDAGGAGPGPAWSLTDTQGATHARDAPDANATVLFFMATWCSSCKASAPTLAAAHDAHAGQGVRFLSASVDPSESPADLEAWKRERAQPWPHGVDRDGALARAFGITTQSSVVVLDAQGRVVESWGYGQVTAEGLGRAVERALAPA